MCSPECNISSSIHAVIIMLNMAIQLLQIIYAIMFKYFFFMCKPQDMQREVSLLFSAPIPCFLIIYMCVRVCV